MTDGSTTQRDAPPIIDRPQPSIQRGVRVNAAPAVSVVMPCYNVARYVADAIDSVLRQTFNSFECIVVDDGSPDSLELTLALNPYFDDIVYIRQENRGLSGARNAAIRAARGEFIALLDPDDLWEPNYLEVQVEYLRKHPHIAAVYPDAMIFGDAPEAGRTFMEVCPSEGEVTLESVLAGRCVVFICATARRTAIERAGMFDEELGRFITEDMDLWMRLLHQGDRIAYHRQVLARYRRRADSITADFAEAARRVLRVLDKVNRTFQLSASERAAFEHQRRRCEYELRLEEGKRAFVEGDFGTALRLLREARSYKDSWKLAAAVAVMRVAPDALRRVYLTRNRRAPG